MLWGRRICPSMHLAEASILLIATRLLWALDIVPVLDQDGNSMTATADPEKGYGHRIIANPKTFPVDFRSRSEERNQVIQKGYEQAVTTWDETCLDLSQGTQCHHSTNTISFTSMTYAINIEV